MKRKKLLTVKLRNGEVVTKASIVDYKFALVSEHSEKVQMWTRTQRNADRFTIWYRNQVRCPVYAVPVRVSLG